MKKETMYTTDQVSKIVKNIFKHLRSRTTEHYNELCGYFYDSLNVIELNNIEKHWIKKYEREIELKDSEQNDKIL